MAISAKPPKQRGRIPGDRRVRRFVHWWFCELSDMSPRWVRRALGIDPDQVIIRLHGVEAEVVVHRGRRTRLLGHGRVADNGAIAPESGLGPALARLGRDEVRVVLALDRERTLGRSVRMPRAAADELEDVLAFEVERQTPFEAGEVYLAHFVDRAGGDERTMQVAMTMAPRRTVDSLVEGMRGIGLDPHRVIVAGDDGSLPDAALMLPVPGLRAAGGRVGPAIAVAAVVLLVLGLAAAISPLAWLRSEARGLATVVDEARSAATATVGLEQKAERLGRGLRVLARAQAEAPSPLFVLDALTRALPDGTWLTHVNMSAGEVVIEGRTDASAELVGRLEISPLVRSVSYLAPVTRDPNGKVERFSFALDLDGG